MKKDTKVYITTEQLSKFLKDYEEKFSVKLDTDVYLAVEPPFKGYYDFTNYSGFDAIIAGGHYNYDLRKFNKFFVVKSFWNSVYPKEET